MKREEAVQADKETDPDVTVASLQIPDLDSAQPFAEAAYLPGEADRHLSVAVAVARARAAIAEPEFLRMARPTFPGSRRRSSDDARRQQEQQQQQ